MGTWRGEVNEMRVIGGGGWREKLTVDVALAFICLRHEEVGDVAADVVFVADGVTAEDLLQAVGWQ